MTLRCVLKSELESGTLFRPQGLRCGELILGFPFTAATLAAVCIPAPQWARNTGLLATGRRASESAGLGWALRMPLRSQMLLAQKRAEAPHAERGEWLHQGARVRLLPWPLSQEVLRGTVARIKPKRRTGRGRCARV